MGYEGNIKDGTWNIPADHPPWTAQRHENRKGMMNYTYELDKETGICTVHVTGTYRRLEDTLTMQDFVCRLNEETGCTFLLFDMRDAEIASSTTKTYYTVAEQAETHPALRKMKTAVLYPVITDDARFFENVAYNRGFPLRAFDSYGEAVTWLKNRNHGHADG